MNNLKEHYPAILEACKNCAEVGYYDDPISNGLRYEEDGILVELNFTASGHFAEIGDGCNTSPETILSNVRISVEEIEGSYSLNGDSDTEDIPGSELTDLAGYLEKELPSLLED